MTEVRPEELRVSDDERRAVDARLHRAVGEGRLTLLEYEERAGLVWAARTRGELATVTRDLPDSAPARPQVADRAVAAPTAGPPRRRRRGRRSLVRAALAGALLLVVGSGAVDAVTGDGRLALLGGAEVQVGADQEELDVTAVMGGAQVVVSGTGTPLELDATTMWGGVDVVVAPTDGGAARRRIAIDARALMGGVTVTVPKGTTVRVEGAMLLGGTSCEQCPALDGAEADVVVDATGAMGGVSVEVASARQIRAELAGEPTDEDEGD